MIDGVTVELTSQAKGNRLPAAGPVVTVNTTLSMGMHLKATFRPERRHQTLALHLHWWVLPLDQQARRVLGSCTWFMVGS
jgi:hypothetical protein